MKKTYAFKKTDIVFALFVCLFTLWQVYRAPFGLDRCDECFYLTVPYRFLQGDVPVVHEWNMSQLSGLLLTPIMWVYEWLGGSGEGIVLTFRYIYAAFQSSAAIAIYLLLRKKNTLGALLAALVFLPFSPYYIMALSYNSMCIALLTLAGLITCCCPSKAGRITAGLMFAGAVLCCPYLVLLYVSAGVILLIRRDKAALKAFGWFTLGCAAAALAVAAAILPRTSLGDIGSSVLQILNDPEHSDITLVQRTGMFFKHLLFSRKISLFSSAATFVLLCACLADKKRGEHKAFYAAASALTAIVFTAVNYRSYNYINFFMLPLTIPGAVCYVLDENRDKGIFRFVYLTGWAYAYFMILSSNNFYEALTASLTVSSVAGAFFAGKTAQELFSKGKAKNMAASVLCIGCAAAVCAAVTVGKNGYAHCTYLDFSLFPTKMLNYTIEEGPAKGLITYDNEYAKYCRTYEQAEPARNAEGENVLYLTHDCYLYLADSKRAAGYSGWLSVDYEQSTLERLREYYALCPEKKPDVVYIEKELNEPRVFASLIRTEDFKLIENDTAYIYVRK